MLSKQQIKFINGLRLKKFRVENGLFVCEGAKIVHELLQSRLKVHKIYALKSWINQVSPMKPDMDIIQEISEKELGQISQLSTPNEVVAIVEIPENSPASNKDDILICLESIRDPGNLGTIIRIADWYGLKEIICSEDCADAYNSKVVQASMGSLFRISVNYLSLRDYLSESKMPKYAATLENSINLHEYQGFKPGILLIGNESAGLSPEILKYCDTKLHIPSFGKAESLNAAVATGIFLDAMRRQIS